MTYRIITNLPTVGGDNDTWGTELNDAMLELDAGAARVVDVYDKTTTDATFIKTVNGVGPDATGDVAVAGGGTGGAPADGSVTDASIVAGGLSPSAITGTAVVNADTRLSDARAPLAHKASHATGGTDALTASDIGALAISQRGVASGVASLGVDAKVPESQLPAMAVPGGTGATTFRIFRQSTAPTSADGAVDGDVWIQTA